MEDEWSWAQAQNSCKKALRSSDDIESTFPLWVSSSCRSNSCVSNMFFALFINVLWSSILILLFVLSWHVAHLSIHILCGATMHRALNLINQVSFLCLLNTQVLKDFGKISCQRFLMPKRCKSLLVFEGASGKGMNYGWNKDSINISGVKSSSVNLRTSFWRCTNRCLLKSMNSSFSV